VQVINGVHFIFLQDSAVCLQLDPEEWFRLFFPVYNVTDVLCRKPFFLESIDNFLGGYLQALAAF